MYLSYLCLASIQATGTCISCTHDVKDVRMSSKLLRVKLNYIDLIQLKHLLNVKTGKGL